MSRLWAIFFHGQKVSEKVPSFYQVKKGEFNTGIVSLCLLYGTYPSFSAFIPVF